MSIAEALEVDLRPLNIDQGVVADYLPDLDVITAYELRSDTKQFGGISGVLVDGAQIWLLSDRGYLFGAEIVEDGEGQIVDLRDWQMRNLQDAAGPIDSEALAWTSNDDMAIAIEGLHRVRCVGRDQSDHQLRPCELAPFRLNLDSNAGMEALVDRGDGTYLALIESDGSEDQSIPMLQLSQDRISSLRYRTEPGFRPTGADRSGNKLFIIERRLSFLGGWQARIVQVALDELEDFPIQGRELGRIGVGMEVDNFEAIAARQRADGTAELLIFSDDNYFPAQRTLFYQLAVKDPPLAN